MKLVNEVFEMYKNHLTGDEEDVFIIIYGTLEGLNVKELESLFLECNAEEKYEMVALYLYEKLRLKMEEEGIGTRRNVDDQPGMLH